MTSEAENARMRFQDNRHDGIFWHDHTDEDGCQNNDDWEKRFGNKRRRYKNPL